MKKYIFGVIATLALIPAIAISNGHILASAQAKPASAAAQQVTASFSIENMTCASCPISVRTAMKRVDGVNSVEIDYESKMATVVFDPAKTNTGQIAEASTKVGYPATEIKE